MGLIKIGEFSRLARLSSSPGLAFGIEKTLEKICDVTFRPHSPSEPVSPKILEFPTSLENAVGQAVLCRSIVPMTARIQCCNLDM
eukprot:3925316-Pyramimonas_sp.AAC.1